ncbi:MAG: branched chain amino acid aminotransferase, partial [Clostridia bacterium]|nr:branched chain amino acid aminotransferase [Clostridia bacterium]
MEIKMNLTKTPKEKPDQSKLGFGKYFTDHMFVMDWDSENGWHDARIEPFGPLTLHPAATVFHYGAEIFEGL